MPSPLNPMVISWLHAIFAAVALLLVSAVGAEEGGGVGHRGAPTSTNGSAKDSSVEPTFFYADKLPLVEFAETELKEADTRDETQAGPTAQTPSRVASSTRDLFDVSATQGPALEPRPALAPFEAIEWVQLVVQSQRMPFIAKAVGKITPTPPTPFRPQSSLSPHGSPLGRETPYVGDTPLKVTGNPTSFQEPPNKWRPQVEGQRPVGAARTLAVPATGEETPQLFGELKLEVPTRLQVVVEVEKLQKGASVLYVFRWGKPASWAEKDFWLEVREEGVYVQEVQEPLMFSNLAKKLRETEIPFNAGKAVFHRANQSGTSASGAHLKGFQRLEGTAGCRGPELAQADDALREDGVGSPQLQTQRPGNSLAAQQKLGGLHLRVSAVPLYYAIQVTPALSGGGGAYGPVSFMQHSLCLVFSGPPMLQLLPLSATKGPSLQRRTKIQKKTDKWRSFLWSVFEVANFRGPPVLPAGFSTSVCQETAGEVETVGKKPRPRCIRISQLPALNEKIKLLALATPRASRHGIQAEGLAHANCQSRDLLPAEPLEEDGASGEHILQSFTDTDCEAPYSDYVYFSDQLAFTPTPFDPEQASDACSKAWPFDNKGQACAGSSATVAASAAELPPAETRPTPRRWGASGLWHSRGRQLLQAPSVTFVWKQFVSFGEPKGLSPGALAFPQATPEALWDLMRSGESPCNLLGFRAWKAAQGPPPASPSTQEELGFNSTEIPLLNSCGVFEAAVEARAVTAKTLLQPRGISWAVPQWLLPEVLQTGAGSVVYHLRLLSPSAFVFLTTTTQQSPRVQASPQQRPAGVLQQKNRLWVLRQAFEVREPGYGEWRLRPRRMTGMPQAFGEKLNTSAADAFTLFALSKSCRSVIAEAIRRSQDKPALPSGEVAAATAGHDNGTQEEYKAVAGEAASGTGSAPAVSGNKPLSEELLDNLLMLPRQAWGLRSDVLASNHHAALSTESNLGSYREGKHVEITRQDCMWCSKAIEPFMRRLTLSSFTYHLALTLGSFPALKAPTNLPSTSQDARRLSAESQRASGGNDHAANDLGWRSVGPPVLTSLSLTPAAASGGRSISVIVDFLPFSVARARRCSPLMANVVEQQALETRRLYFYAIGLRFSKDAAPPQRSSWDEEVQGQAGRQQRVAGKDALNSPSSRAFLRLPVICEDPDDSENELLSPSTFQSQLKALDRHAWRAREELLPADWSWQPTTYLLQWQLLEATRAENFHAFLTEENKKASEWEESTQQSDADVWLHVEASSEVSAFCSQPCPSMGTCAITDRLEGFAVYACRCAYGYSGVDCDYEYMSTWLRLLAQGTLVFSNLAMLPSVFLCIRLALRHFNSSSLRGCPVCAFKNKEGYRLPKKGLLGLWQKHSCFLVYNARALAYFSAFAWSALFHACVDASIRFPLESHVLHSLDFLFCYYALFVTAVALTDFGSAAEELLALAGVLALLSVVWLSETFEQRSATLFVFACIALPLIGFCLRATAIWRQAKDQEERWRARDIKQHLAEWQPEDVKWLDSPSSSDAPTNTTEPSDVQERNQELHAILKQKMDDACERVCLAALGQAIARLEVLGKCQVALCCAATKGSISDVQSLLGSGSAFLRAAVSGNYKAEQNTEGLVIPYVRRSRVASRSTSTPLSWTTALGIALTQRVPRAEFLAVGVLLAVFGLGCLGVPDTSANYWLLHSLWHVTIQSATCFILLSRLHHPTLSDMSYQETQPDGIPTNTQEIRGCQPSFAPLQKPTIALPSRSLSEALASADWVLTSSSSAAPAPLAAAFWRTLQQNQSRLVAWHLRRRVSGGDLRERPQQERFLEDIPISVWSGNYSAALSRNLSHTNMQQFVPTLVWLLVFQYPTHRKAHGYRAAREQQFSGEETAPPSPTEGQEDLVKVGSTAAVKSQPGCLFHSQEASRQANAADSELGDWNCLWCIAREALDDVALLRVHEQRIRWVCQLRLSKALSCCPLSSWSWGSADRREDPAQIQVQASRESILLCS